MYMYETSCGMLWPLAVINEITTPAIRVIYHISLEWDYKQHITVKSRKCIYIYNIELPPKTKKIIHTIPVK